MKHAYPDGIEQRHLGEDARPWAHWLGLGLLGIFLAAGLSGRLGGWPEGPRATEHDGISLSIETPSILRSGQVFEIRIVVEGNRPIEHPTLAFSGRYMRNLTINTVMPEAAEHGYEDGAATFGYDRLDTGKELRIKLDGQVNPTLGGGNDGWVELRDGEAPLVGIRLKQEILP